jgi:hypothetical protein
MQSQLGEWSCKVLDYIAILSKAGKTRASKAGEDWKCLQERGNIEGSIPFHFSFLFLRGCLYIQTI